MRGIYERAALCRAFEEEVLRHVRSGAITFPYYSSVGQEYIPATVSAWLDARGITDRQIFVQHRAHSQYLSFGGDIDELVLELLGDPRGCSGGMGGTNCLQSKAAGIYGHDGLLGTQAPIAVGACYGNRKPTICFLGDAAAEEDYALAAFGWAATQKLPILFVVEDNNLSILTEKRVRRSWDIDSVARAFGLDADDVPDDPNELYETISEVEIWPCLLNVRTHRMRWHAGAGVDDPSIPDRHRTVSKMFEQTYVEAVKQRSEQKVREAWERATTKVC